MNDTERNQLVEYFAAEFERLADAARPYRGISPTERRELTGWLKLEFRRLAKAGGDLHSCVVVDCRRFVVPVAPRAVPHLSHGMSLPACLLRGDTEASLARLGLPHTAYVRPPVNEPRL